MLYLVQVVETVAVVAEHAVVDEEGADVRHQIKQFAHAAYGRPPVRFERQAADAFGHQPLQGRRGRMIHGAGLVPALQGDAVRDDLRDQRYGRGHVEENPELLALVLFELVVEFFRDFAARHAFVAIEAVTLAVRGLCRLFGGLGASGPADRELQMGAKRHGGSGVRWHLSWSAHAREARPLRHVTGCKEAAGVDRGGGGGDPNRRLSPTARCCATPWTFHHRACVATPTCSHRARWVTCAWNAITTRVSTNPSTYASTHNPLPSTMWHDECDTGDPRPTRSAQDAKHAYRFALRGVCGGGAAAQKARLVPAGGGDIRCTPSVPLVRQQGTG